MWPWWLLWRLCIILIQVKILSFCVYMTPNILYVYLQLKIIHYYIYLYVMTSKLFEDSLCSRTIRLWLCMSGFVHYVSCVSVLIAYSGWTRPVNFDYLVKTFSAAIWVWLVNNEGLSGHASWWSICSSMVLWNLFSELYISTMKTCQDMLVDWVSYWYSVLVVLHFVNT